jgi:hypothetical protein
VQTLEWRGRGRERTGLDSIRDVCDIVVKDGDVDVWAQSAIGLSKLVPLTAHSSGTGFEGIHAGGVAAIAMVSREYRGDGDGYAELLRVAV